MRIKGLVRCADEALGVVVQSVYQWLEIGPGRRDAPERSRLAVIGRGLDHDALRRGWETLPVGGPSG